MKYILIIVLLAFAYQLKAQNYKIIKRDTINIRGYVYKFDGSPAPRILVSRHVPANKYFPGTVNAVTDLNGYFEMKGIDPTDTLYIMPSNDYINVVNKGSRFLNIYLPSLEKKILITQVNAVKKHPKPLAVYKMPIEEYRGWGDPGVDLDPQPVGGMGGFQKFLNTKIIYPAAAIENNIEGTVEISFSVMKDGRFDKIKVLRGLGYGCDEAAINALKAMPAWRPGVINGRPFEAQYTIDVEFNMVDK